MYECQECKKLLKTSGNSHLQHIINEHGYKNTFEYALKYYKKIGEESNSYKLDHDNLIIYFKKNKTYSCEICNMYLTENSSYIESHIKRIHGITNYFEDYYKKFYRLEGEECLDDSCGLCNTNKSNWKRLYDIDHRNKTYKLKDRPQFICDDDKCKEQTSLKIFGTPYDKKTYEHIGSTVEYLVLTYKVSEEYVRENFKTGEFDQTKPSTCTLEHFKIRHGEEKGKKLYDERNKKIGRSNTIDFYIEKHGVERGKFLFEERREKIKKGPLGTTKSKVQEKFYVDVLSNISSNCLKEYPYDKTNLAKRTDFYFQELNTHIEFYGDYWHASKKMFKSGDFHKTLKVPVDDIWERDNQRIEKITETGENVIIVWESTYNEYKKKDQLNELLKLIKDILYAGHKSRIFRL